MNANEKTKSKCQCEKTTKHKRLSRGEIMNINFISSSFPSGERHVKIDYLTGRDNCIVHEVDFSGPFISDKIIDLFLLMACS